MGKIAFFGILVIILLTFFTLNNSLDQVGYSTILYDNKRTFFVSADYRLNITYPNGGDIISGEITIRWIMLEELVDDSISYQVHYSPDGGNNWLILSGIIFETIFVWNTTLYESYCPDCTLRITAQSKLFEAFSVVSDSFTIDNREINKINEVITFIIITGILILLGFGIFQYQAKFRQKTFLQVIQSEKHEWIKLLSQKVVIGLDNIKNSFVEELPDSFSNESLSLSSSVIDLFPMNIRYDLQHNIKGRTILTLVEIAYQNPSETNPSKISKSLNIPLSTLSKEIKKLIDLNYVESYLTNQMILDARFKSFNITPKGFKLLLSLDKVLKITIDRSKN